MRANPPMARVAIQPIAIALIIAVTSASPAIAAGTADIQSFVDSIKDWLTGDLAKSVAVIAIAVTGYRFFTGRASAGPLIAVVGGIFLIFGSAWLLSKITGNG
ncbi:type IV secretion system protein VirB2 [Sphingomonas vulcanisoli]|uniref:Type IV secretion system protein VirB2 n=1 Tax=Sphingomonas vulcanisoli TaxID=1658060 RepID=A0ABX0TY98_9SPHN|nr:TrbC/VirB2 family protein [Sphingomonas vulcanisoli]NIJ09360.1 type IV secretion system protein VirB2 [Sphingomonas vulcanisoli]